MKPIPRAVLAGALLLPICAAGERQAPPADDSAYRSAFTDYRPFKAAEPMKEWKRANDEVRDAGGHVGLMKVEGSQPQAHGGHGAKKPAPRQEPR